MIKYFWLLLLIVCGCRSGEKENDVLHVAVLRGPSVIAFAKLIEDSPEIDGKKIAVDMVDSPELMQALLIKNKADLAVLPMINAANLYNKGLKYSLLGCPVWGNLYIVGKTNHAPSTETEPLYIFGAGTTPDILTRHYLHLKGLSYPLNHSFATPREISLGLLGGQIRTAVLAEPFLSMVLRKDSTLQILHNLNNPDSSVSPGFAQTAIVYAPSLKDKKHNLDSLLNLSCRFATACPEEAIRILENHGIFAPGFLTPASIERCNIKYIPARDAQESILDFLRVIEKYEPKAIGGKLPGKAFICDEL